MIKKQRRHTAALPMIPTSRPSQLSPFPAKPQPHPQPAPNSYTSSNMNAKLAQVYGLWRKEWLLRHEGVLLV